MHRVLGTRYHFDGDRFTELQLVSCGSLERGELAGLKQLLNGILDSSEPEAQHCARVVQPQR